MTTRTVAAAELAGVVRAVEKSAAKDDSRPVLAGIQATITGDRLTLAAAPGSPPTWAPQTRIIRPWASARGAVVQGILPRPESMGGDGNAKREAAVGYKL